MNKRFLYISFGLWLFLFWSCKDNSGQAYNKASVDCDLIQLESEALQISSGQDFKLTGNSKFNRDYWFILSSTWSSIEIELNRDAENKFIIPGSLLKKAGLYQLKLMCNRQQISNLSFKVTALKGHEKMSAYLGPNSLITQSEDEAMLVTVPTDTFGNVLEDNMSLSLRTRKGGNPEVLSNEKIKHGLSYKIFDANEDPGKILVGANSDQALLIEQDFLIQAGLPSGIKLQVVTQFPFADGRQFTHLKTSPIKDFNENLVEDGTMVWLSILSRSGNSEYRSFTVGGVANFFVQNPENETTFQLVAGSGEARSNTLSLFYRSNIKSFEVYLKDGFVHGKNILAGMNQKAVDGTTVRLDFMSEDRNFKQVIEASNGAFEVEIRPLKIGFNPRKVKITIGGITKELRFEE